MELILIAVVVGVLWKVVGRRAPVARHRSAVGPIGWCDAANWRVVLPLARADTRSVLRHPAFVAGAVLTPLMILAATADEATGSAATWRDVSPAIALALVPLAWLTIVAVNLVALRPQRVGADEMFAALPTPQPVRSIALLVTALGPVTVAAALAAGAVTLLETRDDLRGAPLWSEITVGILIVAGGVAVGVAVARWLARPVFGVIAAVATAVIQARFFELTAWPWYRTEGDQLRFLSFIADVTGSGDAALEVRPAGSHLVYLVGLVVVVAAVAVAREGLRRPITAVLTVAMISVIAAGWLQTRPPSERQQAQMVDYLTNPAAHQRCEESGGVRYCAYPGFTASIADWRQPIESTLAALPPVAAELRGTLEVTQRPAIIVGNEGCAPTPFEASLPPSVAARVSPAGIWPADDKVHPGFVEETFPCSNRDVHGLFLAVQAGAWAVGLPPAPHARNERCTASGQSRAAIALWAAAAATSDGEQILRDVREEGVTGDGTLITFDSGDWNAPPMWGVDYATADAEVALAMLGRPGSDIVAVLGGDWSRWTDPGTSSTALARAVGVDAPGPPADGALGSPCP